MKEESPKISVLMGIYNCEKTLKDAIDCIINQTVEDWEFIICDDGSTDASYEVAMNIAQYEKRIILIENDKNMGLAATLNNCLKYARGVYVARMDGDDLCDKNRFQEELDFLEKNKDYSLVSCNMITFDSNGIFGEVIYHEDPTYINFLSRNPFCHAGCMMRKSILIELGGYNETEVCNRIEDYDLWVRLYAAGYKGKNLNLPLYSMRDDRSATKRRKYKYRINEFKLLGRICKEYKLPYYYYILTIKPLVVGLVPIRLYELMHRSGIRR